MDSVRQDATNGPDIQCPVRGPRDQRGPGRNLPLVGVTCQVRGHLSIPGGCGIRDEREQKGSEEVSSLLSDRWVLNPVPCGTKAGYLKDQPHHVLAL